MTVNEIKQKLDELGIEYDSKMRKDDLLKLLNEHSEEEAQKERPKRKSFVVIYHRYKDLEDNDKVYKKGDPFNHVGKTKERIKELSTTKNKIGKVLIKEID